MQGRAGVLLLVGIGSMVLSAPTRTVGAPAQSNDEGNQAVKKTTTRPVREYTEWCRLHWSSAPDTSRPRVLLIGDSIVVGYHGEVSKLLKGKANVDMLATSKCIADPAFLKETELATEGYDHDVIHFNNGLHGWHVTEEEYASHLARYVKQLRRLAPKAKLIWGSTTPVSVSRDPTKLSPQKNPRVIRLNRIAADVMQANHIPINDLYGLVVGKADLRAADGFHYNRKGHAVQGKAVAEMVRQALEKRGKK